MCTVMNAFKIRNFFKKSHFNYSFQVTQAKLLGLYFITQQASYYYIVIKPRKNQLAPRVCEPCLLMHALHHIRRIIASLQLFSIQSFSSMGGEYIVRCKEHKQQSLYHCLEYHLIIFVLGFIEPQPKEVVEQESQDVALCPNSESSEDIKESDDQKQTENLTNSPTGMVIICFISLFLKTGHYVLLEYGRWYWVLKV